jgi:NADP-dependent 3-hydroxy acid dehydrogenase YdfG
MAGGAASGDTTSDPQRVAAPQPGSRGVAVVSGASSGIGAATARHLHRAGFSLVLGARRADRLRALADELGGADAGVRWATLDVTDAASVAAFGDGVDACTVLVNSAGGALGLEPLATADLGRWRWMFEANVVGTAAMVQSLLPAMERTASPQHPAHVVNIGSVAGFEPYPGGSGYNAAKFAVSALTRVMRQELLGRPIRVTEILPGAVETEFSIVRFDGDETRAKKVYDGIVPLVADDVADTIAFVVTRPPHVNIDSIVLRPIQQATATLFHRVPAPAA